MTSERPTATGLSFRSTPDRDPLTGYKRWVSRPVPGKGEAALKCAKQIEAELLVLVAASHHRGSKTAAELIERWLEGRQSVRLTSSTTIAACRGRHGPLHLPSLGKVQVAASWSHDLGHLLRPPALARRKGRSARLLPADQDVGAGEVEAGC